MTSSAMSSDTADTLLNVHRYRASERAVRAEKQKSNVRCASFGDWSWIEIYRKQMDHFVRNDTFTTADVAPAEASKRTANAIDRICSEYVAIALHCRRDDLDNTLTDDRGLFQISEIRDSSCRRVIPAPWWLKPWRLVTNFGIDSWQGAIWCGLAWWSRAGRLDAGAATPFRRNARFGGCRQSVRRETSIKFLHWIPNSGVLLDWERRAADRAQLHAILFAWTAIAIRSAGAEFPRVVAPRRNDVNVRHKSRVFAINGAAWLLYCEISASASLRDPVLRKEQTMPGRNRYKSALLISVNIVSRETCVARRLRCFCSMVSEEEPVCVA